MQISRIASLAAVAGLLVVVSGGVAIGLKGTTGLSFHATGSMVAAATQHRAARLADGKVLITGGQSGEGGIPVAQLFDPTTGIFTRLPDMIEPRFVHSSRPLPDGRVLVAGGFNKQDQFLGTTELFDGERFVEGPSLLENRDNQRTVPLADGRIFVSGGDNEQYGYVDSTEIFDPERGTFEAGPLLPIGRAMDSMTLLSDGRVLMAGGLKAENYAVSPLSQTLIYDPSTNDIKIGPDLLTPRKQHRAVLLGDGSVLITGGLNGDKTIRSAELFRDGQIYELPDMLEERHEHCTVLLPDGRVLIAGGYGNGDHLTSTELYDPVKQTFSPGPSMLEARSFHTCTALIDGSILLAGGSNSGGAIASAEVFR